MVSAKWIDWSSLGLSSRCDHHYVAFLGKTVYSHSASLEMGTSKINAAGNPAMDSHPIQGE